MHARPFGDPSRRLATFAISLLVFLAAPLPALAQVSSTLSFYVPQTGAVATPTEGTAAARFFTQCPNNDFPPLVSTNARIKIVVKDGDGNPMAAIPAASICAQLNGGTAAQGFSGAGADTIIANSQWNQAPPCPDVRCIPADAPTDVNGVTYITFAGATPGFPGVATRDPSRKWGRFDSEIPVFVQGTQLSGRLVSGAANGTYTLRFRNFDVVDGLGATQDDGEYVSFRDYNVVVQELGVAGGPLKYWLDFDGNGVFGPADLSLIAGHLRHDCAYPNNP